MSLVYGSVCSGIEAATVAWHSLGWRAAFYSEIEPFPAALLQHYYPQIPNHGDLNGFRSWPEEKIDLLVGGTPCQSFSVAGLRRGLADPRGNLMLTFLALADRLKPRWLVWENVPGVLSSGGGRDFGSFLGALGQLGYGFAYRVLDAQYFGVPQRRRRVFVVGCLGDWRRAAAVLFERHSLQGNPAPSREAGQGVAGTFKACAGSGGWSNSADHAAAGYMQAVAPTISARTKGAGGLGTDFDCDGGLIPAMHSELSPALKARDSKGPSSDGDGDGAIPVPMVSHALRAEGFDASEDGTGRGTPLVPCVAPTLRAGGNRTGGDRPPGTDVDTCESLVPVAFSAKDHGADAGEIAPTLRGMGHAESHANGGVMPAVAVHDACYNQGIDHACTQETDASALLRALRKEVGPEAFTQWGLGVLDSLLPAEVLRSCLHGGGVRLAAFSRSWLVYHALARQEAHSEGLVLAMREAEREGCASQGWRPPEQLALELGAYLSELSQPGAQATRFMRDLWQASEGLGLLRQALSAVQEVGRSTGLQGKSAHSALQVRRLTVEECEFLQGFPRGYTSIPYRGKQAADGPRYKALGNSMAVPVMAWIGRRIALQDLM